MGTEGNGSLGNGSLDQSTSDVLELCDQYRALNDLRIDIDRRLMALPEADHGRDILWQELEDVLARLSGLAAQLAATSSTRPAAVRAKAVVLALMLRAAESDPATIGPETAALALSLADEVAGLA